jgi:starch phosphorylase
MKVLVNGGLNLSELDGWWAEAYTPEVGWALGDQQEHGDDPAWDIAEAERLYSLLEDEVIPEFYHRDSAGIPRAWVERVRESIAQLTPRFSSNRTVREYTEQHYLAAAEAYRTRSADRCAVSHSIVEWQRDLAQQWGDLRFGSLRVEKNGVGSRVEVDVYLAGIDPDHVRVELYANPVQDPDAARLEMTVLDAGQHAPGWLVFGRAVSDARPPGDYTARLTPRRSDVALPLEVPLILWQR